MGEKKKKRKPQDKVKILSLEKTKNLENNFDMLIVEKDMTRGKTQESDSGKNVEKMKKMFENYFDKKTPVKASRKFVGRNLIENSSLKMLSPKSITKGKRTKKKIERNNHKVKMMISIFDKGPYRGTSPPDITGQKNSKPKTNLFTSSSAKPIWTSQPEPSYQFRPRQNKDHRRELTDNWLEGQDPDYRDQSGATLERRSETNSPE